MTTNCVFPPELDDKQLLAYLDAPQANPATARHLESCPHCRERANALDRFQKRLTTKVYRITCPSPMELGEFHMQLLSASNRLVIGQHLRQCPRCTEEISLLKDYLSEDEPQRNILESVQEFFANLISRKTMTFGAVRGAEDGPLTYQVDDILFSINVNDDMESPGYKMVLGLVEGLTSDGFTMEAHQEGNLIATSLIDEFHYFQFTHLDPGMYDLVLSGWQTKIHLKPSLEVL